MEFFEPPPLPEHKPRPRPRPWDFASSPWMGAPANVLGGIAPLRFVVASTPALALTVTDVCVYGNGFTFKLNLTRRDDTGYSHRMFRDLHEPLDRNGALKPGFLRFGLAFADGRKATNLQATMHETLTAMREGNEPPEPLLRLHGGGGSPSLYRFDYWAWPLPPPGPLGFVCEWPSEELPLTRRDIDAETILEASTKARRLWGDGDQQFGLDGSGSYLVIQTRDDDQKESSS